MPEPGNIAAPGWWFARSRKSRARLLLKNTCCRSNSAPSSTAFAAMVAVQRKRRWCRAWHGAQPGRFSKTRLHAGSPISLGHLTTSRVRRWPAIV